MHQIQVKNSHISVVRGFILGILTKMNDFQRGNSQFTRQYSMIKEQMGERITRNVVNMVGDAVIVVEGNRGVLKQMEMELGTGAMVDYLKGPKGLRGQEAIMGSKESQISNNNSPNIGPNSPNSSLSAQPFKLHNKKSTHNNRICQPIIVVSQSDNDEIETVEKVLERDQREIVKIKNAGVKNNSESGAIDLKGIVDKSKDGNSSSSSSGHKVNRHTGQTHFQHNNSTNIRTTTIISTPITTSNHFCIPSQPNMPPLQQNRQNKSPKQLLVDPIQIYIQPVSIGLPQQNCNQRSNNNVGPIKGVQMGGQNKCEVTEQRWGDRQGMGDGNGGRGMGGQVLLSRGEEIGGRDKQMNSNKSNVNYNYSNNNNIVNKINNNNNTINHNSTPQKQQQLSWFQQIIGSSYINPTNYYPTIQSNKNINRNININNNSHELYRHKQVEDQMELSCVVQELGDLGQLGGIDEIKEMQEVRNIHQIPKSQSSQSHPHNEHSQLSHYAQAQQTFNQHQYIQCPSNQSPQLSVSSHPTNNNNSYGKYQQTQQKNLFQTEFDYKSRVRENNYQGRIDNKVGNNIYHGNQSKLKNQISNQFNYTNLNYNLNSNLNDNFNNPLNSNLNDNNQQLLYNSIHNIDNINSSNNANYNLNRQNGQEILNQEAIVSKLINQQMNKDGNVRQTILPQRQTIIQSNNQSNIVNNPNQQYINQYNLNNATITNQNPKSSNNATNYNNNDTNLINITIDNGQKYHSTVNSVRQLLSSPLPSLLGTTYNLTKPVFPVVTTHLSPLLTKIVPSQFQTKVAPCQAQLSQLSKLPEQPSLLQQSYLPKLPITSQLHLTTFNTPTAHPYLPSILHQLQPYINLTPSNPSSPPTHHSNSYHTRLVFSSKYEFKNCPSFHSLLENRSNLLFVMIGEEDGQIYNGESRYQRDHQMMLLNEDQQGQYSGMNSNNNRTISMGANNNNNLNRQNGKAFKREIILGSYFDRQYPHITQKHIYDKGSLLFIDKAVARGNRSSSIAIDNPNNYNQYNPTLSIFQANPQSSYHYIISNKIVISHGNTQGQAQGIRIFKKNLQMVSYYLPTKSYWRINGDKQEEREIYYGECKLKDLCIYQIY